MIDRAAIFLIMLFVLIGAAAYDHYLVSQGKVGPFEHMMDYAGLGRYGKTEAQSQRKIKREVFNRQFDNLQSALQKIEEQRAALIAHRQEILVELAKAKGQMQGEVKNYIQIMNQEQSQVMEENRNVKPAVSALVGDTLNKSAQNEALAKQQATDQWKTILNTLGREDQIFADNNRSIDQQWQSGTDETVNKVKALVEKLDTVSEEDWRQLMKLYEDLWQEQAMLMEGTALTAQRLNDAYSSALRQTKALENNINPTESKDSSDFVSHMKDLEVQLKSLTKNVISENEESHRIFSDIWSANNQFFNNALVLKRNNIKPSALVTEQGPASDFNRKSRPVMDSPVTKALHQPSIDEQLRPLREKAKENSDYLHSNPSK